MRTRIGKPNKSLRLVKEMNFSRIQSVKLDEERVKY
jgi:hypothetical protein